MSPDAQAAARQHDGHRHGAAHALRLLGHADPKSEEMTSIQRAEQLVHF